MKARKGATSNSGPKGGEDPSRVEAYLAGVPEPARKMLCKMRATIGSVMPLEAVEAISYSMPAFKHRKVTLWYAAFKDHCSLFPGATVIERFKADLEGYVTSRGTIRFPLGKPLPLGLIKRIVKARLEEGGH